MAVHTTSTQSADHTVAAEPAPAEPAPVQRARTDLPVGAAAGRTRGPTPRKLEGVRAAASVMGWVLWILLALITAVFLTFAPWLL